MSESVKVLPVRICGTGEPTLLFLHFLGGSGCEWAATIDRLKHKYRCVQIDLPGFGEAALRTGYSVGQMADAVAGVIRSETRRKWVLVGHSMGAKIAAVVARRSEDGEQDLTGLAGLVLLAGSPPTPEPMQESRRETMKAWFAGDAEKSRKEACEFIKQNLGGEIEGAIKRQAVEDVLRMDRAAWIAWLDRGSREDWSVRVGVLQTPALIMAGEKDAYLGPEAQRRLMLPHFAHARVETLMGAGHLLPMERPEYVMRLITELIEQLGFGIAVAPAIDPAYKALIDSNRVSARTREVLLERAKLDEPAYESSAMSMEELATLRALVDRVVPQADNERIDLAARIDKQLGQSDGWRFALLPIDAKAYSAGLHTLDLEAWTAYGKSFGVLDSEQQDELLTAAAAGNLGESLPRRVAGPMGAGEERLLNAQQMQMWFEDVRADAVRAYVAHPVTMARMGYTGIADGAVTETMEGFVQIGAGERESWEPVAKQAVAQ